MVGFRVTGKDVGRVDGVQVIGDLDGEDVGEILGKLVGAGTGASVM